MTSADGYNGDLAQSRVALIESRAAEAVLTRTEITYEIQTSWGANVTIVADCAGSRLLQMQAIGIDPITNKWAGRYRDPSNGRMKIFGPNPELFH